jgi:hypothetical protein
MNKKLLPLAFALAFATGAAQAANFTNGSFETGDFTGWVQGGGSWTGSPLPPVSPSSYAGGPSKNYIVGPGADALTGLSTVYGGSLSWTAPDRPATKLLAPRAAFDRMFRSRALAEDLGGRGDITSQVSVDASAYGRATIQSRGDGVIAGLRVAEIIAERAGLPPAQPR